MQKGKTHPTVNSREAMKLRSRAKTIDKSKTYLFNQKKGFIGREMQESKINDFSRNALGPKRGK